MRIVLVLLDGIVLVWGAALVMLSGSVGEKRVYRLRTRLKRRFNANTNEHLIQRAAAEGFVTLINNV